MNRIKLLRVGGRVGTSKKLLLSLLAVGVLSTAVGVSHVASKGGSSPALCTASDPASKLNVQVKQGSTIIYPTSGSGYGTLAGFAAAYTGTGAMLHLKGGGGTVDQWVTNDSATFTINVN